jgi:DNA-directed RNA polymerase subunit RPC12/RpoP
MDLGFKIPISNDYLCSDCEAEFFNDLVTPLEGVDDSYLKSLPFRVVCAVCNLPLLNDERNDGLD